MLRSNAEVPKKKEREIQETAEQVDCSAKKNILRMLKPGVLVAKTETVDSNLKTCFLTTALLMLLSQARCVPQFEIPPIFQSSFQLPNGASGSYQSVVAKGEACLERIGRIWSSLYNTPDILSSMTELAACHART
jgi:hypothetical protein